MPPNFPPRLFYREQVVKSGFSPRALRWLPNDKLLFVGCKDGSIWVVEMGQSGGEATIHLLSSGNSVAKPGSRLAGVRALCPCWSENLLVVGRSDGALDLLQWSWKEPSQSGAQLAIDCRLKELGNSKDLPSIISNPDSGKKGPGIKALSRLDGERWAFLSAGKGGTWILDLKEPSGDFQIGQEEVEIWSRLMASQPLRSQDDQLITDLRMACSVQCWDEIDTLGGENPRPKSWLLITERAKVFTWAGPSIEGHHPMAQEHDSPWSPGEQPTFINDYSRWGDRGQKGSDPSYRGIFLATDRGVFLVVSEVKVDPGGSLIHRVFPPVRQSLPGLGLIASALSYAEVREPKGGGPRLEFLWVVDARGNCHLFCDRPADRERDATASAHKLPNFRSSGFTHIGTQALLAYSWQGEINENNLLNLVYARQDDGIGLGRYRLSPKQEVPTEAIEGLSGVMEEARSLLGSENTCIACLRNFLEKHDDDWLFRWKIPSSGMESRGPIAEEILADFFEFLAEMPSTCNILKEFLSNPSARNSSQFLLTGKWYLCPEHKISGSPVVEPEPSIHMPDRALRALDLWTLTLLGVVHRSFAPFEVERYSLGILRWLEDSRQRFWTHTLPENIQEFPEITCEIRKGKEKILGRFEDCVRMVRKWGLFGESNSRRPGLIRPIEILSKQGGEFDQKLDLLSYETLLLKRNVDLIEENLEGQMEGRSCWDLATLSFRAAGKPPRRWVAISWRWGGVELFELGQPLEKTGVTSYIKRLAFIYPVDEREGRYRAPEQSEDSHFGAKAEHRSRRKYGHSRAVLLTEFRDQIYLVLSVAGEPEPPGQEEITVYRLTADSSVEPKEVAKKVGSADLPEGESAYSLLDLGGGRLIVGLRGREGLPTLQLLRLEELLEVRDANQILSPVVVQIKDKRLGARAARQNRTWSLAKPWRRPSGTDTRSNEGVQEDPERYEMVMGCEGGEIWRLAWPAGEAFCGDSFEKRSKGFELEPVFRVSSSVMALAYRRDLDGDSCRIFAGGQDGSVIALQRLGGCQEAQGWGEEKKPSFTSLWATWEQGGPIETLHFVEAPDPLSWAEEGKYSPPRSYLVSINRAGYCTLFDDREKAPDPPEGVSVLQRDHRIPFPGCRHGRYSLGWRRSEEKGQEVYGALFLAEADIPGSLPGADLECCGSLPLSKEGPKNERKPDAYGRLGVVLSASGYGALRLQGLHLPDLTPARRKAFQGLLKSWWRASLSKEGVPQLRLGEAGFGASSAVSLSLVRWLLEDRKEDFNINVDEWTGLPKTEQDALAPDQHCLTATFPRRWQLPRILRPLLDLRRAWQEGDSGEVERCLETALRIAHRIEDLDFYQEICEVSLREANRELIRAGRKGDKTWHERARDRYQAIFKAVDRSLEQWQGRPRREESRARMTVAKNLVDGFTFLTVLRRAGLESPEEHAHPFRDVLDLRVAGVRQLVFKRDPLVSLEALRAANLSLMRLCRVLVLDNSKGESRRDRWQPRTFDCTTPHEVRWEELEAYSEQLLYAAAQAFRSPSGLSDAVVHEYARSFALLVCACPSAALRVATRMTETRLVSDPEDPLDLSRRVDRQLRLLNEIGLPTPMRIRYVFRLAMAGWGYEGRAFPFRYLVLKSGLSDSNFQPQTERTKKLVSNYYLVKKGERYGSKPWLKRIKRSTSEKFGFQNAADLLCIAQVERIFSWFEGLSEALGTDAQRVYQQLKGRKRVSDALKLLEEISAHDITPVSKRRGVKGVYEESRAFLAEIFEDFMAIGLPPLPSVSSDPIRPDLLNAVYAWSLWARDQEKRLGARFDTLSIFQPEYSLFFGLLRSFQRAASGFRESAVVQKAVVGGVLGHHLLEDLDEHVLELEEIAENLDPEAVRQYREQKRNYPRLAKKAESMALAERFANYLLRRSHGVGSIPKNLRSLYAILRPSEETEESERSEAVKLTLEHLVERYCGEDWDQWNLLPFIEGEMKGLSPQESVHLELALVELQQNHLKYSGIGEEEAKEGLRPKVGTIRSDSIRIEFPFRLEGDHRERLMRVIRCKAQQPVSPGSTRSEASSGTGLYLANLAAAVVRWELSVGMLRKKTALVAIRSTKDDGPMKMSKIGWFWIQIQRIQERVEK